MKNKGFTLIELMIVIAIITILSSIGIQKYSSSIRNAKDSNVLALLSSFRSAYVLYITDNSSVEAPSTIQDMEYYLTNSIKRIIADGITSGGAITSYQVKAGTVVKNGIESEGYADFEGEENIAELYYNSDDGVFWVDGTKNDKVVGEGYTDTRGELWKNY
jgi:prepilin-type N-terminal cleavage/methylation domain-containing protein